MGQILYGASLYKSAQMEANISYDTIGKNSEAFTAGDPVTISSNVLLVAGTTDTIVGIVQKTATMASNNQTVAKVTPGYIPIDINDTYLMGGNTDLTSTASDSGKYYQLIAAATGAMQINTSGVQATTSRVVEVLEVDPFGIGGSGSGSGLRQYLVKFVKTPSFGALSTT